MDFRNSYVSLVKGVQSFDFSGGFRPSELLLTGDKAFPVLVSTNGQVLIASTQYGKGRMVVVSHEEVLKNPQFLLFIKNALQWLKPSLAAQVGVHASLDPLSQMLLLNGVKVQPGAALGASLGVYCTDAYDETHADNLVQFVKHGGGLLIAGQALQWTRQHGMQNVLLGFPGNWVTSVAGVYFTGHAGDNGMFPVSKEMPKIPLITQHGLDIQSDLTALLNGITKFNIQDGVPSQLLIYGALAFPVAIDDSQQSFLAAARYGRGRVIVSSHENLFSTPSMKTFILNAIHWLSSGKGGKTGVGDYLQDLYSTLDQAKIPCELTDLKDGLSVYCCMAYSDREVEKIHEFVSEGGGLLIGGQAWSWAPGNTSSNVIAEYPGNKILKKFGIAILGDVINSSDQSYPARQAKEVVSSYHFRKAFFQFQQHIQNQQALKLPYSSWIKKLVQDSVTFLKIPAADSPPVFSIHEDVMELIKLSGIPDVSANKPIKSNSVEAFLISLSSELYNISPEFQKLVSSLNQHLGTVYPISPPQTIRINGKNNGNEAWRSTGLYVPPAKTATLLFPYTVTGANLQVQIGCHSDDLSDAEELKRAPVVTRRFEVKTQRVEVSSLWGGLLYIIVPEKSSMGHISVTIEGAVQAPYFKHGETSASAWQNTIRHYTAPWAELETENIVLTVPTEQVQTIDNPEILLTTWDNMMKGVAKLASIPAILPRPERIVADVQISVGWMHSGYPVMLHLESVQEMIDVQSIHAKGLWGPIHELGHNQQQSGWDFPPHTTEATCNLWSVYVNETILNTPRERAHEDLLPELRKTRIENYVRRGQLKDFEIFTALEPYLQLQEAFGWEPYMRIFAEYQKMTKIPEDNESKMNLWAEKFSQQVNRNLAPFFKAWKWPIKDELSQKLARSFPTWVENPMQQYASP
ncbi:TRPM8 channel-associated factor 2-like [Rhineura floridana]|uniref:TRPM8 channel-associated factor 2-like n=1 Tax=Rhineura floridana TaxID=261503 RepID=UPI002AC81960|nr:TRPM8 channel-associated factor 2-like [Rhineura floridana]